MSPKPVVTLESGGNTDAGAFAVVVGATRFPDGTIMDGDRGGDRSAWHPPEMETRQPGASDVPDRRKRLMQAFDGMPLPSELPPYNRMIVDSEDHLWVQDYPKAGASTVKGTVFEKSGKLLAEVVVPAAFEIYEIYEAGRDYVLGRYLDRDEQILQVRIYSVRR